MFDFIFFVFAFVCVGSALFVAFTPNVVHAALGLASTFATLAGFYILLGADFLAITQIAIYVGGILVLMLFGIMYTHNIARVSGEQVMMQVGPALLVVVLTLFTLVATILSTAWPAKEVGPPQPTADRIGVLLLTDYLLPFEVAGILLLVALVGAVVIAQTPVRKSIEESID
ncbi:MAG: NADH-quinone oxidoreductase subunit J [Candidatus Omnitrophica bacterium]|nr:NADH-quinone oxidoreductase subunit J [Candidatus Omnitrophota bacterium]MCA9442809.1 NADH-quinone oxidoreductase subunit J [Candidatus Omnitrophota bacterium]MCB9770655.1 NADH-quinone oxidoreductase subunit J [Candidatus Omnitrophota bacterium]MCB9783692.1 NADH-quinone oxidoreductase subunit J [Candidatus Omnitrophota bacterium]